MKMATRLEGKISNLITALCLDLFKILLTTLTERTKIILLVQGDFFKKKCICTLSEGKKYFLLWLVVVCLSASVNLKED